MTSVAAQYEWLFLPFFMAVVAFCLLKAGINASRAALLSRYRDIKHPDPLIAEALKESVPPPYSLYALAWAVLAILGLACAYFVLA